MKIKMAVKAATILAVFVSLGFSQTRTIVLQQGFNGYSGCTDRELRNPEKNYRAGPSGDSLLVGEH